MTMAQWVSEFGRQIQGNRREILTHNGTVSKHQAIEKVEKEFETCSVREMQQLECDFDRALKKLTPKAARKNNE